jgi:HSP20 family protein
VNLKESERELVVTAEVPGLSRDELEVTITEDAVTLKGERREDQEAKEEDYHCKETAYGAFERVIPLPAQIKANEARARLKDGVLTLALPKIEGAKRKQVKVRVE